VKVVSPGPAPELSGRAAALGAPGACRGPPARHPQRLGNRGRDARGVTTNPRGRPAPGGAALAGAAGRAVCRPGAASVTAVPVGRLDSSRRWPRRRRLFSGLLSPPAPPRCPWLSPEAAPVTTGWHDDGSSQVSQELPCPSKRSTGGLRNRGGRRITAPASTRSLSPCPGTGSREALFPRVPGHDRTAGERRRSPAGGRRRHVTGRARVGVPGGGSGGTEAARGLWGLGRRGQEGRPRAGVWRRPCRRASSLGALLLACSTILHFRPCLRRSPLSQEKFPAAPENWPHLRESCN
jgi:hypothetical protein